MRDADIRESKATIDLSGDANIVLIGMPGVGSYEDMCRLTGREDPFKTFQQTVETSALVIGLQACREQIWMSYTKEEKDRIASLLSGFAHGNTVPQNWRFFNMLDLAFRNDTRACFKHRFI